MRLAARTLAGLMFGLSLALAGLARGEGQHGEEPTSHAPSHGEGHGHLPRWQDVNWYEGMLGEKEDEPPSILWRAPGRPIPVAALALNSLILFYVLIRFAKKPVMSALSARKTNILRGMEEAGKMKSDAEARLKEYEDKLSHIDEEVARAQRELREAGEHERTRILAEAKERRARMERDASLLIEQELKAWREILLRETVQGAMRSAERAVSSKITAGDQQRLADEYLTGLKSAASTLRGKV